METIMNPTDNEPSPAPEDRDDGHQAALFADTGPLIEEDQPALFPGWKPAEGPLVALKPQERGLLKGMLKLCERGKSPSCYGSQEYWARNMGLSAQRVWEIVRALKQKGFLLVIKQGRNNNALYYPSSLEGPFTADQVETILKSHGKTKGYDKGYDKVYPEGQTKGYPKGYDKVYPKGYVMPAPLCVNQEPIAAAANLNSEEGAAAADDWPQRKEHTQSALETIPKFKALGWQSAELLAYIHAQPALAAVVALWLAWRRYARGEKKIRAENFVTHIFRKPEAYSFVFRNGVWYPPNLDKILAKERERQRYADAMRQQDEEFRAAEARCREEKAKGVRVELPKRKPEQPRPASIDEAAKKVRPELAAWWALPEAARQKIDASLRAAVLANPLLLHDQTDILMLAIAEAKRQGLIAEEPTP
jgi:hypothetical protein